mmetsp:Transcript_122755/g.392412  ORF Transcript_122755/g.392412 Transcript_122755/m.392412 type:complete len:622 (-) Transcript_122755:512-2377(-)
MTVQDVLEMPAKEQLPEATTPKGGMARKSDAVKVFSFIDSNKKAANLSWEGLGFSVATKKAGRKEILKGMSGELLPGELTCILGPSGSGKTSLLNLLAGRVRKGGKNSAEIPGEVKVNGKVVDPTGMQQLFGYVMQDDALLGTMTPREILHFAARLRLGTSPGSSRNELIEDLLLSLGLIKCADTMVGNELIKGISGGERKRTAVGAELITNPEITFLDEPTSGLDTGAAYNVISILQQLCHLQRSVLCTIHQPSSEIFHLFDQAIFLVAGQVVYHGHPSGIRDHFNSIGHVCPQDYNPADFVMFIIQTGDEQQVAAITAGWAKSETRRPLLENVSTAALPSIPKRKGFFEETIALSKREIQKTVRDKGTLGARFGSTIFLTVIYSLVFFRIGSMNPEESVLVKRDKYDMQSHAGAMTMLGISGMFGSAQPLLLTFASERPVFMREYASNMYGAVPYFLSKTAVELPVHLLQNIVMWLIAYWAMACQGDFVVAVCATTLISMAAASTALLAACLVADAKQAMEAAPALFVPQILFAGFFIKMEMIPSFMRWLQYICSLKWGMNIIYINEFIDAPGGKVVMEANEIKEDNAYIYVIVLLAIFVGFRLLAMVALSRKAKAFYN